MTVERFLNWLRSHADRPIEGCSGEDIEQLITAQGVLALPPAYKEFMRGCGRQSSPFREGTILTFPLVAEAKDFMQDNMREASDRFELPDDAFVFYDHQGYHFWYFPHVHENAVWEWLEGHEPQPFFASFEDWLDAEVAYHEFAWGRLAASARGETIDWSDQFDYEPFRTLGP